MPATGLNVVGTGACLPWCSISSSFQNSLKTSGHRSYEFLEFWCWFLVPFLPDIGFQLLKSLWSSLTYFLFNDVPNVLYRWKIWTAGRPIQHPDSSTMKPCCCNSCSMWFCIVLLKYTECFRFRMQRHDWSSMSPKEPMLHLSSSHCTGYQWQLASSSRHWCLHTERPQAQHPPTSTHYYESTSPP